MEQKAILKTARLLLRPVTKADSGQLFDLWNRSEVGRFLWDDESVEMEEVYRVLEVNDGLHRDKHYGLWLMHQIQEPKQLLGFCGLWHYFGEARPQLIYGLNGNYWKRGFATEAAGCLLVYCFEQLEFDFLHAAIDPPNVASESVLLRLGFEFWKEEEMEGRPTRFFRKLK